MTFEEIKALHDQIDAEVTAASAALQTFPKGHLGLTPDEVKASSEFRAAMQSYNSAFLRLRSINYTLTHKFADELRQDRLARRASR